MTVNELKEQLTEKLKEYSSKVSESETFVQLSERYNNFSPTVQLSLKVFGVFLAGYLIYSVPAGFVDSSKEHEATFVASRELIRGLFRSARTPSVSNDRFKGQEFADMKSQVEGVLTNVKVLEAQKGTFAPANKPLPAFKVPSAIRQAGMTFELKMLNLSQVVNIGEKISAMHPNTKLASVEILADKEDPHYFNVTYTLSSLSLPVKDEVAKPAGRGKRR